MHKNKMIPSKRRSESRRSSILKPRKPRQPLQNVNFDSSSNDSSPTTSKIKRRVSFAEIKHVKEFCHSTEQGTVWDSTYEEHDSSLKRSFGLDQNTQVESNLVDNQLLQKSVIKTTTSTNQGKDANYDLNVIESANLIKLPNASQLEHATLPNKSCTSKSVVTRFIVAYSDSDEESEELLNKKFQPQQSVITDTFSTSKNEKSKNIVIYNDYNDECHRSNITDKCHYTKEQEEQKCNNKHNSDTNTHINDTICNDMSMEITENIPIITNLITSDLRSSKQISTILFNSENPNTHNADVNYANDSMALTCVIQSNITDTETCCSNNMASNILMEKTNVPYKIYEDPTCNKNTFKEDYLRKDQTDKTEIFSDMQMEMTKPLGTILSSNTSNKENMKMDEIVSGNNKTMVFHNVSMEMTKPVISRSKEFLETNICKSFNTNTYKSSEDICSEKNENILTCSSEEAALCKSMELTETVPTSLYHQRTFQAHDVQPTNKNIYENYKNDRTEFFNNMSMEITKPVNILHPSINKSLENDEIPPKYNKTILFHDGSIEMTAAVTSKNQNKITQQIACKSVPERTTLREKSTNSLACFNEETKLLCKSMELTEVVPITLCDENRSNIAYTAQSFSQTLPKTTLLPVKDSTKIVYAETVVNKTIQDTSMEITATMSSTLKYMQDLKENKTKNLTISKNDEYQQPTANNILTEINKSVTKEIYTNSRSELKENIKHNELSNFGTQFSPDKLSHLSNTNFENINNEGTISTTSKKRKRYAESESFYKKFQFSPENNKIPGRTDTDCNSENDKRFVKSVTEHMEISGLNLKDSLHESNENNFIRNLSYSENNCEELNLIQPPSFVCLESDEEKSYQKLQQTTNASINNVSNCLTEELKNIENTQVEDYDESLKNITEDSRKMNTINKNALSIEDIRRYTSLIVKEIEETYTDRLNEKEHTQERIDKDLNLQNIIKENEQYTNKIRQEPKKCSSCFEDTDVTIKHLMDNSKRCEKILNNETKQNVEECATQNLIMECINIINDDTKNESLTEKYSFSTLMQQLEMKTREDCIWNIFYKNIDKNVIVFGFMANSLLIPTYLTFDSNNSEENLISDIKIMSRIADDAKIEARIAHKLFIEKINAEMLRELYKTHNDILPMLNFLTQEVKLAADFMFDLRRLDNVNLMEINLNEISFISRSKHLDIILNVKIKVKSFDKITSDDISLDYLLGQNRIKERDVKYLIKHVKKDHQFLRRYMNDVKDYIDIMEETFIQFSN